MREELSAPGWRRAKGGELRSPWLGGRAAKAPTAEEAEVGGAERARRQGRV